MKQNNDVKQEATYRYSNMPYDDLEIAFNSLAAGVDISVSEREVLEIIAVTRCSIEPFRYKLWRNCPAYFEVLFGHEAREDLNKAFDLFQASKLVDMNEFKNFCDAELVNL